MLFFTGVRILFLGYCLKELEEGHAVLMREALTGFGNPLPPGTDIHLMLLGNDRADLPLKRPDGTIGLWGMLDALFRAQVLPKYHHGMRQPWHSSERSLPRVQQALYERLLASITTSELSQAVERFGGAMHTLQDTYTLGHTQRENNADPVSPLVAVHYSPSREHPFISPNDRVWADSEKTKFTPEALAAIQATVAALELWTALWPTQTAQQAVAQFVQKYVPIRDQVFQVPVNPL
jgi:hypothetical protein